MQIRFVFRKISEKINFNLLFNFKFATHIGFTFITKLINNFKKRHFIIIIFLKILKSVIAGTCIILKSNKIKRFFNLKNFYRK